MIKQLQKKSVQKKIWIILTILVLPAFLIWGSGNIMRGERKPAYVGTIFGKRITTQEFEDALTATRNIAMIRFGDNFPDMQKYLNLSDEAWLRLIQLAEARKRRIKTTDQEVIALIQSYPFFHYQGKFDQKMYSQMLERYFYTQPRLFEEQARQNIILAKLYDNLTAGIALNDEETQREYRKENEKISISYMTSLYSDYSQDITASDEELKEYYAKHALDFKQPLAFNIEYITLDSEEKIKTVYLRAKKKGSWENLSQAYNLSVKETGLFNQTDPIPGIGWSPQIFNLISKLKGGQLSPPIRLDQNYYILRLKDTQEAHIPDLDQVKDRVKEAFIKGRAQGLALEKIERCFKKLQEQHKINPKALDFEHAAREYGLKSGTTDLFKSGSYIEGIGGSDLFFDSARNLKDAEFSPVIAMPAGYYIVKLKSLEPVDEKKFLSEKKEFSQNLLAKKKLQSYLSFLEGLKKRAQLF